MGSYTELIFGAKLKSNTPEKVINTLRYYCEQIDVPEKDLVFKTTSGRNPLNNGGSYYFGVVNTEPIMYFDKISNAWVVSSRTNLKNYENEISDFLTWIKPFIEQGSGGREMYAIVTHEECLPEIYYLEDEECY